MNVQPVKMSNNPLITAAQNKAIMAMKELIKAKFNLNLRDQQGRTALHYACHKAMGAEMLLRAGADPDLPDKDDNYPIHMAATEGFDNVVITLLDYGCNPDSTNCFHRTAAHYLAMKNHCRALNAIASAGGNLNVLDSEGNSPLMYAIQRNRPEAVKVLLLANCRPRSLKTPANNMLLFTKPLKAALQKKLYGIAKLLILAGADMAPIYEWIDKVETEKRLRQEEYDSRPYHDSDEEEIPVDEEQEEAVEWFSDWIHRPHTLMQLCRLSIREFVGARLFAQQDNLPVPPAMRDYITLKEVDDHPVDSYLI